MQLASEDYGNLELPWANDGHMFESDDAIAGDPLRAGYSQGVVAQFAFLLTWAPARYDVPFKNEKRREGAKPG